MKIIIINNKWDEGEDEHLFCERDDLWCSLFMPHVPLTEWLMDQLDELYEDEFDLPEGWREALERDAQQQNAGGFFSKLMRWQNYSTGQGLTRFGDWEVSEDVVPDAHIFGQREKAALLAGLRMLQNQRHFLGSDIAEIATGGASYETLNDQEIGDLCERLNQ